MNDTKIARADLSIKLRECHAMACFLAISIGLILEEYAGFTEICPAAHGAEASISALAEKLKQLEAQI